MSKIKLSDLKQELPYKWRVQSIRYGKASCVAYIDARDAMDLLDKVVGPENWQDEYYEACGLLMCSVGIRTEDGWAYKADTGTESNVEKDKGHASDAFKRACVKWGIGRFLYSLKIISLPTKSSNGREYTYFDKQDKILYGGAELSKVCNYIMKQNGKKS